MVRTALVALGGVLAAQAAAATTFVNGDFSQGFTGYDVRRLGLFGSNTNTGAVARIADDGGDPYLELDSFSRVFNDIALEASQGFDLSVELPILSFYGATLSTGVDTGAPNGDPGAGEDILSVQIRDATDTLTTLFVLDDDGSRMGGSFPEPDLLSIDPVPGALLSERFTADLGAFAGTSVELIFLALSTNDGSVSTYGIDDIAFSARPSTVIPLPAALPGLAVALAGLALAGRRRG